MNGTTAKRNHRSGIKYRSTVIRRGKNPLSCIFLAGFFRVLWVARGDLFRSFVNTDRFHEMLRGRG